MKALFQLIITISLSLATSIGTAQVDTLHTHIEVSGDCEQCSQRIDGVMASIDGVYSSAWSPEDHILHIDHDASMNIHDMHNQLALAGHGTDFMMEDPQAFSKLPNCCAYVDKEKQAVAKNLKRIIHTDIFVDGICGMCEERIESIANNYVHVYNAQWDVETRQLHLDHGDKLQLKSLQKSLARAGHDTEFMAAPKWAYNQLHACCKYKDEEVIADHADGTDEGYEEITALQGMILEQDANGQETPVIGANVYWKGTTIGSTTDIEGYFNIPRTDEADEIIVSYVSFENDTIAIDNQAFVEIVMSDAALMREVVITYKRRSTDVSMVSSIKMQNIGEKELLKAACCNLSESFETNPTVDASVTDAVTGTRQIKMLGLAGPNIQITREGIPDVRGLSALYGLTFTPGTWIKGININTGAGSVVNGFESMVGQIDVSLRQPPKDDRLFVNIYGNEMARMEANVHATHKFNDALSATVLLHGAIMPEKHDENNDGFLDHPTQDQFVVLNRWKYFGKNGKAAQIGVKLASMSNEGGQEAFDHNRPFTDQSHWGSQVKLKKYEVWAKAGNVFLSRPHASIGTHFSFSYFDQESFFGRRKYDGDQTSWYGNVIYQSHILDARHGFKTGMSIYADKYNEFVNDVTFKRTETTPGAFFEYSYKPNEKFSLVLGLRGDHHSDYGFFATPRLHGRYAVNESTVFRISGGRGQRTASIFAENIGMFASSREIQVESNDRPDLPYGLDAEVAWTYGGSFVKEVRINERPLLFQFDVYRSEFQNQIVLDYDISPQVVQLYNLDGESYSNSVQIQVDYELAPRLDFRMAYRYNDVKTTYRAGTLQKPLTSRDRAFANIQYQTRNGWSFDFTQNWQSKKRLPTTVTNPEPYRLEAYSDDYFMSNMQITKSWNNRFDVYIGGINIFDYQQADPILAADNPFSDYFDASIIWAPIFGREIYGGIRYRIK